MTDDKDTGDMVDVLKVTVVVEWISEDGVPHMGEASFSDDTLIMDVLRDKGIAGDVTRSLTGAENPDDSDD